MSLSWLLVGALLAFFVAGKTAISAGEGSTSSRAEGKASFESLRQAVESEPGGYVHPSLGLFIPAPCGADRGIGVVSTRGKEGGGNGDADADADVVLRIPFSYQLTRSLAIDTLTRLIPHSVLRTAPLDELDDAALLVLLLAHERGLGPKSKFEAYLRTLPEEPGCGWTEKEPRGWEMFPTLMARVDILQAANYASRVSTGLANDYGNYLDQTYWSEEWKEDPSLALAWSLCVVSSRGTAANSSPGGGSDTALGSGSGTRLIPLMDLINHDINAGGFIELTGTERLSDGDFLDAAESDMGTFVVRSIWNNGTMKKLKLGEEVLVNYNLPDYQPLDWFLSLGFVPPEVIKRAAKGGESGTLPREEL